MALNYIWIAFIVIAFFVALLQMIFFGNISIFNEVLQSIFGSAKSGFEISLGLTGILTFWMGILKVAEHGGALKVVSRMVAPQYFSQYVGQYAGTRQCGYAHGAAGYERNAGVKSEKRYRFQSHDHVSGAKYCRYCTGANDRDDVSYTVGSRQSG